MSERRWDIALGKRAGRKGSDHKDLIAPINLPTALARAVAEAGYNRARVEITEHGILVRPYKETGKVVVPEEPVTLPGAWESRPRD